MPGSRPRPSPNCWTAQPLPRRQHPGRRSPSARNAMTRRRTMPAPTPSRSRTARRKRLRPRIARPRPATKSKASTPKASRTRPPRDRRHEHDKGRRQHDQGRRSRRFSRCSGENRHGPVDRAAAGRDCSAGHGRGGRAATRPAATALATTANDTPESEPLAAMQAAAGVAPNAAPKPIKGDKADVPSAKTGAPADPQAGVPLTDSVKDGQASSNGDKAARIPSSGIRSPDEAGSERTRATGWRRRRCGQGQRRRGAKS